MDSLVLLFLLIYAGCAAVGAFIGAMVALMAYGLIKKFKEKK